MEFEYTLSAFMNIVRLKFLYSDTGTPIISETSDSAVTIDPCHLS